MKRSLRRGLSGLVVLCLALVGMSLPADAATKITPGVAFTLTVPAGVGKTSSYTFSGTAGKRLVVAGYAEDIPGVISLQLSGPGFPATDPLPFGPYVEFGVLPTAGTWTLKATNLQASKATGSATVSLVTPDVTAALPLGTSVKRSFSPAGQDTHLTFSGTSGQKIGLQFTKVALSAASLGRTSLRVQFRRPDGTVLGGQYASISAPYLTTWHLDATGTWTIDINPQNDTVGSATLVAKVLPDKVLTPVLGRPTTVTLPGDGSGARFTVNAVAGQRLTLGIPAVDLASVQQPRGWSVTLNVLDPQGRPRNDGLLTAIFGPQWEESTPVFDTTGTYTVVFDPYEDTKGTMTFVPNLVSDPVSALTFGTQQTITLGVPGQNPVLTFPGTAGQHLVLASDESGLTAGSQTGNTSSAGASFRLVAPDGTELRGDQDDASLSEYVLPMAGTWRLVVDPSRDTVGTLKLLVRDQVVNTQPLTFGTVTSTPHIAGGDIQQYTFSAVAGQKLGFDIRTVQLSDPGVANLTLIRPDGTRFDWSKQAWGEGGYAVDTPALDASGTWTLQIDPVWAAAGSITLVADQSAAT
jgi:hypothetical protein